MSEMEIAIGATVITIFLLVLIAGIAFTMLMAAKQKMQQRDRYNSLLIEHQWELRQAEAQVVESTVNNLSRDIHDNLGQAMTYMNLQLENKILDHPDWAEELKPVQNSIHEVSDQLRQLSRSLSQDFIQGQNLSTLLKMEVERMRKLGKFCIEMIQEGEEPEITHDQKLMVYRIFQEATNNIMKHALATQVRIQLTAQPFSLLIKDDGKGFDPSALRESNGLLNMEKRAELASLKCNISSQEGLGSEIKISTTSPSPYNENV